MWKKALTCALRNQPWRTIAFRRSSSISYAVDSAILRSLKDHYLEATKTSPPPKMDPPEPFEVMEGAMDGKLPVLRRSYGGGEEIRVSAARSATIHGGDGDEEGISEVLLHVEVSKLTDNESLHFICGLYPDALGIHSVFISPNVGAGGGKESPVMSPTAYNGPNFRDLDGRMRDIFHKYIEERGVNESLFPFLQVWLYVKEHRKIVRWFKSVGTYIYEKRPAKDA